MNPGDPPLRIGTVERTAAMKALDEHLAAGRLGVEEYADRSAAAANATVAPELAALFTDLPAPHPELPGAVPAIPPTAPLPAVPPSAAVSVLGSWGPRVVAVTPILAVALFLLTRQWVFFLLVPAAAALVYGGGVGRDDDERRQRRRDR
jgi:hypothetical protein